MPFLIAPEILGARLKAAREKLELRQGQVAEELGLARTTIVAIEAGKRTARATELRALCSLYGVRESELLSTSSQPLDLDVKFRATAPRVAKTDLADRETASALLNRLAASALELEQMLGCPVMRVNYPVWRLNPDQPLEDQAEDAGLLFRQHLGLGLGPLPDLKALLELEFGFRIFERPLAPAISGACAFHESHGAFVLLNSNHWRERRQQTVAHEVAHGMVRPSEPLVIIDSAHFATREDKFCDAVARAILLPSVTVRRKAEQLRGLSRLTVRHILWLAAYFRVSIEAMARRMEALRLIKEGTYELLKTRGLSRKHLEEVVREADLPTAHEGFTPKLLFLATEAHARDLLSEQQIAERLELPLSAVRRALDDAAGLDAV